MLLSKAVIKIDNKAIYMYVIKIKERFYYAML